MHILRCLLLPIRNKTLILPCASVAEVVSFDDPLSFKNARHWVLGAFAWRNTSIPLVSLELNDTPGLSFFEETNTHMHIAILNRIHDEADPEFVGVVLQNIPRMSRFKRSDIQPIAETEVPHLLMEVSVRGVQMFIPNLLWIQKKVH